MATQKTELVISARDQATQVIAQVNQGLVGLARNLGGLGALSAGLSVGVLVGGLRSVIGALDDLSEAAQNAGIAATVLADLRIGAQEAGVGVEQLDKAIAKLNILLAEARGGDKRAQGLLGLIGVDFKNKALDAAGALEQMARAMSSFADGDKKVALASAVLQEKLGPKFIALLNQGADGLKRYSGVTEDTVATSVKLQGELDKLNVAWERQKNTIAGQLVPVINTALNKLLQLGEATGRVAGNLNPVELLNAPRLILRLAGTYKQVGDEATKAAEQVAFLNRVLPAPGAKGSAPAVPDFAAQARAEEAALAKARAAREALAKAEADAAREFKTSGLTEAARLQAIELNRGREVLDAYNKQLARLRQLTGEAQTDQFLADIEALNQAFFDGRIGAQKYDEAIARLTGQTTDVKKDTDKTNALAKELGLTFSSAFEDAVVGGKGLRDVLKGIYEDLLRIITRQLVTRPLSDALIGALGGVVGSGLGGLFGGSSAGAAGSIGPGSFGGGATTASVGGVTVINNYQIDSRSDRATIIAAMEQTRRQTEASIANSQHRNGAFARA